MANPNGNPGNKGGGRKSAKDEKLMSLVINKSWDILAKSLDNDYPAYKTTEEEQRKVALELAKKSIPKDLNIGGENGIVTIVFDESFKKRMK